MTLFMQSDRGTKGWCFFLEGVVEGEPVSENF
jgi:hypothetical protein